MKKYNLTFQYKLFHIVTTLILFVFVAFMLYKIGGFPVFNLLFLLFMVLMTIGTIYWIQNENLILAEKEIHYEGPDVAFRITWKDLEKISLGWYFFTRVEGIIVDKSLVRFEKMSFGMIKRFPLITGSQKIFIPLSCFSENWRNSELGQQIKKYAPHLFEEKSAQSAD